MCMKRTNLVLREDLLAEATRLSGETTYSRTVERALEAFIRRAKAGRILDLRGSGMWEGNLTQMRRGGRRRGAGGTLLDTSGCIDGFPKTRPVHLECIVAFDDIVTCRR